MWITQTYLGNVEPDAKVFVYYLFEDYNPEQKEFTERVQDCLADLGVLYESDVSLFMPNPKYAARIEAEIRGIQDLWWSLQGELPGIFVSTTPLSEFNIKQGNYYFASFNETNPSTAATVIRDTRKLIDDQLAFEFKNNKPSQEKGLLKRVFEAIEAKPGVFGFTIDLKKLAQK